MGSDDLFFLWQVVCVICAFAIVFIAGFMVIWNVRN